MMITLIMHDHADHEDYHCSYIREDGTGVGMMAVQENIFRGYFVLVKVELLDYW
jgi:hypothetical protein